jgi:uncharacterized OB-fold protein
MKYIKIEDLRCPECGHINSADTDTCIFCGQGIEVITLD